jgi:hypothetical protein
MPVCFGRLDNSKYHRGYFVVFLSGESSMKTLLVPAMICMAVLALLVAGCTSFPQGGPVPPVSAVTTTPVASSTCGFTSCHGLDLACGPNPPQICPLYYQLGDKCRQYAFCSDTGGACRLVTNQQFDTCKSCVEKCGGADQTEIFLCEEKC